MGGGGGQCIGSRRGGATGSRRGVLRNCDDGLVFVYSCFLYHAVATRPWEPFSVPTPWLQGLFSPFSVPMLLHTQPLLRVSPYRRHPFSPQLWALLVCRTAACKVVLGCLHLHSPAYHPMFNSTSVSAVSYFLSNILAIAQSRSSMRSTMNIGKTLFLESLGNERIKHRHRKCSCGPGLRRLYLPYAASAGRLTFSRCPKIAKSDLEGYSFQVANCERNH